MLELYEYVVLAREGFHPLVIQKRKDGYYSRQPQGWSRDFTKLEQSDEIVEANINKYRDDTINPIELLKKKVGDK